MNEMGRDGHRATRIATRVAGGPPDSSEERPDAGNRHLDEHGPREWLAHLPSAYAWASRQAVRAPVVVAGVGVTWLAVFLADLFTRTDLAISVCYVVPIALTLWLPSRRGAGLPTGVALAAALGATLVAVWVGADAVHGPGIRPHVGNDPVALGNRLLGAVSQAAVAWAVVRHRRLRERERELITKLDAALCATDEFIAIASHELTTPLAGARGYAQLLLRRARHGQMAGLDGQSHRALALIDDLLGRLNLLADDLLHVSRLQTGKLDLRLERLDIAALAREVSDEQRHAAPRHAITVMPATGTVTAWADMRRMRQVLTNLIGNAIKYSPDGGPVAVTLAITFRTALAEHLPDEFEPDNPGPMAPGSQGPEADPFVILRVSDMGIGIPEEESGQLFGRFIRASNASTSAISGTGLGLYLCRTLVEAQGGAIWLESSTECGGSTFALALPAGVDPIEGTWSESGATPRHPILTGTASR